jgi:hypothetical protein
MVWRTRQDFAIAQLEGLLPFVGSYADFAWYPTFVGRCVDLQVTPDKPGDSDAQSNWCTVTATYAGYDDLRMPYTQYELSVGRIERPITMHPKFNDPNIFPTAKDDPVNWVKFTPLKQVPGLAIQVPVFEKFRDILVPGDPAHDGAVRFRGIEKYAVASLQLKIMTYQTGPDWSRDELCTTSRPRSAPATYISGGVPEVELELLSQLPDANNEGLPSSASFDKDGHPIQNPTWIIFEKSCRNLLKNLHPIWEITRVFYFNDLGWTDEIYSAENLGR